MLSGMRIRYDTYQAGARRRQEPTRAFLPSLRCNCARLSRVHPISWGFSFFSGFYLRLAARQPVPLLSHSQYGSALDWIVHLFGGTAALFGAPLIFFRSGH
jgi:hypothetical protein